MVPPAASFSLAKRYCLPPTEHLSFTLPATEGKQDATEGRLSMSHSLYLFPSRTLVAKMRLMRLIKARRWGLNANFFLVYLSFFLFSSSSLLSCFPSFYFLFFIKLFLFLLPLPPCFPSLFYFYQTLPPPSPSFLYLLVFLSLSLSTLEE